MGNTHLGWYNQEVHKCIRLREKLIASKEKLQVANERIVELTELLKMALQSKKESSP